jgi:hypothetical protein
VKWTNDQIEQAARLWASGLSTGRIAKEMNITRNAVVGKAHRENFPPRPSPIARGGVPVPPKPAKPAPIARGGVPVPPKPATPRPVSGDFDCQYPTNNGQPWTFCGAPRVLIGWNGKRRPSPYCAVHSKLCMPTCELLERVA